MTEELPNPIPEPPSQSSIFLHTSSSSARVHPGLTGQVPQQTHTSPKLSPFLGRPQRWRHLPLAGIDTWGPLWLPCTDPGILKSWLFLGPPLTPLCPAWPCSLLSKPSTLAPPHSRTSHPRAVTSLTWSADRGARFEEVQEEGSVLLSASWQAVGAEQDLGVLWMVE